MAETHTVVCADKSIHAIRFSIVFQFAGGGKTFLSPGGGHIIENLAFITWVNLKNLIFGIGLKGSHRLFFSSNHSQSVTVLSPPVYACVCGVGVVQEGTGVEAHLC